MASKETEMDKKVYICRGISGAGKSSWIKQNLPDAIVCSADNFFIRNGKYEFDAKLLGKAHAECFYQYINALKIFKENPDVSIAVDNTNLALWEISPYTLGATSLGWDYQIIQFECPMEVAAFRNIHGVPANKVNEMYLKMQNNQLPGYMKEKVIVVKSYQ